MKHSTQLEKSMKSYQSFVEKLQAALGKTITL